MLLNLTERGGCVPSRWLKGDAHSRQDLTSSNSEIRNPHCMKPAIAPAWTHREKCPLLGINVVFSYGSPGHLKRDKDIKLNCEKVFSTKGQPCMRTNRGEGILGWKGKKRHKGMLWLKVRGYRAYWGRRVWKQLKVKGWIGRLGGGRKRESKTEVCP